MISKILLSLFLFTPSLWSQSFSARSVQDTTAFKSGMVYGKNHAFFLNAPKGWILDNSAGVSQGLNAVFYPEGGSWDSSPAVMYANTADKETEGQETLDKFLEFDISQFKEKDPSVRIHDSPSIKLDQNKKAIVKTFFYSNYEAVAYIDEPKVVVMLVLSARTQTDFKKCYSSFEELVKSYAFFTEKVTFDNH